MQRQTQNRRRIGEEREKIAAAYLEGKGLTVLERNYRCRQGEIDIVAREGEYLVFVEVKYRRNAGAGNALEAVGAAKQRRICSVADYYRLTHGYGDHASVRYDVVGIQGEEIRWIPNAFLHRYR